MYFQPIVCLRSGRVVAFEALMRPRRCEGGAGAGDLIAAASRAGRVHELDRLAHAAALASASYLPEDTRVFINALPEVAAREDFVARLARLTELAGIPASRLVIEITERHYPDDDSELIRRVGELRRLGFGIALDDVGAGRSDLGRILTLRPDWIKLDRVLVQGIATDPLGRRLVGALARFARGSDIQVIAEGIELPSQARAAMDLGVTQGQGYWFAHPAPLAEAAARGCRDRVERRWRTASVAA